MKIKNYFYLKDIKPKIKLCYYYDNSPDTILQQNVNK